MRPVIAQQPQPSVCDSYASPQIPGLNSEFEFETKLSSAHAFGEGVA
jgi:hypothetical protein